MKIFYNEKEIDSLSITKISFCNKGLETIQKNDTIESDKITVELVGKDIKILDSDLIYESRAVNKFSFSIVKDENELNVSFDFLDKNDGAIIQILHTSTGEIKVRGTIKGNKNTKIQKNFDSSFEKHFIKIMNKITLNNNLLAAIEIIILLPIVATIFILGYVPEIIFKYNKRLPKKFVLSSSN